MVRRMTAKGEFRTPDELGETGYTYESSFIGAVILDKEYYSTLGEIEKKQKQRDRENDREVQRRFENAPLRLDEDLALQVVRETPLIIQSKAGDFEYDPTNPDAKTQPVLSELRLAVLDEIGEFSNRFADKVRIYPTTTGKRNLKELTSADFHCGVDAFIDIPVPKVRGGVVTVTLDLKMEGRSSKSDIVIDDVPDPQTSEDDFLEKIEGTAQEVVKIYDRRKGRVLPTFNDISARA